MLTMLPPPACRRAGTTALQQFQMPLTFTALAASQSASVIVSTPLEAAVKRGVVDEGVDASERIERGPRHLHRRGGARDIELGADRGALVGAHELERLRAVIDVRDDDTCAEAAEISRVFLPDPARGARNHNDLSFD